MDFIWYYLSCGCCGCGCRTPPEDKQKMKSQKIRNLKTLKQITPESKKSSLWSKTKSPMEMKTHEMTDIYRVPEQYSSENEILQRLGFKAERYIDQGSFGVIFKGEHIHTGLKIAIKEIMIPEPINKRMRNERLHLLADVKNELYTLQKLRHPHVIRLIQHFMLIQNKKQMKLFILMQFASGGTLSYNCEQKGPFDEPQCKIWFAQMLSAMVYMHKEGIAHRDLKQSNILMDDTNDCLVTDFGLSRLVWRASQERILMSNTFCGTPPYIAPEVLALKDNSELIYNAFLADVWALGVILFKMFDNTYPFAKKISKALRNMRSKKWSYSVGRESSSALKDMFEQIFEPNPSKRPTTDVLKDHKWIKEVYETVEEKSQQKLNQIVI